MAIPGEQQCQSSSTPPPLSINQVLALYPRERLQVHPLRWTDRQLALLGCRIHSRHDEAQSTAADEKAEAASSKSGRLAGLLAQRLSRQVCPEDLVDIVKPLLVPLHARRISFHMNQPISFHFNQRAHSCPRIGYVTVSMRRPAPETFTLACLSLNETGLARNSHLMPRDDLGFTDFVGILRFYTLKKLYTPKDPRKDPFLVALVIALAQRERRHAVQPLPPNSSFTVRILFTGMEAPNRSTGMDWPRKSVNLYVAHVQASFLDRFDFPSQEPAVASGLDIDHWHIPAKPFQTLSERVCQALRPEGYGKTHGRNREGHETKRSGLGEPSSKAGKKRKSHVASDERNERTSTLERPSV